MYRCYGKRLFDIVFSFFGLVAVIPVFLIVPVMIRWDSGGPVFFRQKRMGVGGRTFFLLKFRSMASDKDQEKKGFEPGSAMRVTRVGRILRKTKLDEIPQLINVFMGDMSFVGPRPEVERYKVFYTGLFAEVLNVRPGITDKASIKYRHEEKILAASSDPEKTYREVVLPDKLKFALSYVQDGISFRTDIGVILQTLLAVFKRT